MGRELFSVERIWGRKAIESRAGQTVEKAHTPRPTPSAPAIQRRTAGMVLTAQNAPAADSSRRTFLVVDEVLSALTRRGSRKCGKLSRQVLESAGAEKSGALRLLHATVSNFDAELRTALTARCTLCPKKCDLRIT